MSSILLPVVTIISFALCGTLVPCVKVCRIPRQMLHDLILARHTDDDKDTHNPHHFPKNFYISYIYLQLVCQNKLAVTESIRANVLIDDTSIKGL